MSKWFARKRILYYLISAAIWLVIWQLCARAVNKETLIVTPFRAVERIFELSGTFAFWRDIFNTLGKILAGFLAACLIGTALASVSAVSSAMYVFLSPAFAVIKSTPVASFTVLAVLWVKSAYLTSFVSFIMVVPLIYFSVYQGIQSTDHELIEMSRLFQVPVGRRIIGMYTHSVAPYFVSAASTGMGFAWKSGIAAELISLQRGSIGLRLYYAKIYLETADLFAWTIVIILLSVIMELIFKRIARRVNGTS